MSKLFEEALADAKKLKEVAEENAKKAILESITPKIKKFIDQQIIEQAEITEEDENLEEENDSEYEEIDESSLTSLMEMLGVSNLSESSMKNALNKMNHQQIENLNEAAKKANFDDKLTSNRINKQYKNLFEEISMNKERYYEVDLQALREAVEKEADDLHAEEELKSEMYEQDEDMESMDEMDDMEEMEDLMNEIKLALDLGEDIEEDMLPEELRGMLLPEEDEESEGELEMEDEESEEMEAPELEGEKAEGEEAGDPDELPPLEEVFDVDPRMLREELANIRRSLRESKSMDHHFGGAGEGKAGVSAAFGGKGPKRLGHEKSFGGGSHGKDVFVNPPATLKKLNESIRELRRLNRAQSEKLNKYRSAVQTLREQLEDLNLFNAKLLYVNKLLQNKNLNESQKKSVIKALDEAKSLSETKALYSSLTESLSVVGKTSLNESTRFGSSSRATTSASSVDTKTVGETDRWAKLAGLK